MTKIYKSAFPATVFEFGRQGVEFIHSWNFNLLELSTRNAIIIFDCMNSVMKARTPEQVCERANEAVIKYMEYVSSAVPNALDGTQSSDKN
jgi:hypothetical protein